MKSFIAYDRASTARQGESGKRMPRLQLIAATATRKKPKAGHCQPSLDENVARLRPRYG